MKTDFWTFGNLLCRILHQLVVIIKQIYTQISKLLSRLWPKSILWTLVIYTKTTLSELAVSERSEPVQGSSEWAVIPVHQSLKGRRSFHMESNGTPSVQYDRWNEENINMNVEASQPVLRRWDLKWSMTLKLHISQWYREAKLQCTE